MSKKQQKTTNVRQPRKSLNSRPRGLEYLQGERRLNSTQRQQITPAKSSARSNRLGSWIILILLISGLVYEMLLNPLPRTIVSSSSDSAPLLRSLQTYQQASKRAVSQSTGNRLKFLINTSSIDNFLKKQFPEISQVEVNVPLVSHSLTVTLVMTQPALVLKDNSSYYGVSSDGEVIGQYPSTYSGKLPIINYSASENLKTGYLSLAPTDYSFINLVRFQLNASQVPVQSYTIPVAERELDVAIAGEPYFVKFNLNDSNSAQQQIGTFLATQHYLATQHITPAKYIDARVPGRAYYL